MDLWHCQIDGQTKGPFAVSMLELMISEGSLTAQTMVCQVGQDQWILAAHVPGLFGTAAAAAASPPPQPAAPAPQPAAAVVDQQPVPPAAIQAVPTAPSRALPVAPSQGVAQPPQSAVQSGDQSEQEDRTAAGRMLQRRRRNSAGPLFYILASIGALIVVMIVVVALLNSDGDQQNKNVAGQGNKQPLDVLTAETAIRQTSPWRDAATTRSVIGKKARVSILAASIMPAEDDEEFSRFHIEVRIEKLLDDDYAPRSEPIEYPAGSIDPREPVAVDAQGKLLDLVSQTPYTKFDRVGTDDDIEVVEEGEEQNVDIVDVYFRFESPPGDYVRVAVPLAWFDSKDFIGFEIPSSMWEPDVVDPAPADPPVAEPVP